MATDVQARDGATSDHVVLFYESDSELVSAVGPYLSEALEAGEVAIVIATEAHRHALAAEVAAAGIDLAEARSDGSFVSLDAAATLALLMTDGRIDATAFGTVIGGVIRDAVETGRPVRAYGEMVALLWDAGDVQSVIELETLWNELGREVPFSLFCAYPGESVAGPENAEALHQVCHLHSCVVAAPAGTDMELTAEFAAEPSAPGAARRRVVDALLRQGHGDRLVDDAALVLTELATNAVVHARSPFSVSVREHDSVVRISVRDGATALPVPRTNGNVTNSGRGLALVAAIAARWGVEGTADGKVVWAELSSPLEKL